MAECPPRRVFILGGGASLGAHPVGAMGHFEERGFRTRELFPSSSQQAQRLIAEFEPAFRPEVA